MTEKQSAGDHLPIAVFSYRNKLLELTGREDNPLDVEAAAEVIRQAALAETEGKSGWDENKEALLKSAINLFKNPQTPPQE